MISPCRPFRRQTAARERLPLNPQMEGADSDLSFPVHRDLSENAGVRDHGSDPLPLGPPIPSTRGCSGGVQQRFSILDLDRLDPGYSSLSFTRSTTPRSRHGRRGVDRGVWDRSAQAACYCSQWNFALRAASTRLRLGADAPASSIPSSMAALAPRRAAPPPDACMPQPLSCSSPQDTCPVRETFGQEG